VGELVGEHVVHRLAHLLVAGLLGVLDHVAEDVAGQALETAIHAGNAHGRVVAAGAFEEERALREHADLPAQVDEQLLEDLHVAGFVPALAGHVHLELPGCVREVPERTGRALQGLKLANEDAVHAQQQPRQPRRGVRVEGLVQHGEREGGAVGLEQRLGCRALHRALDHVGELLKDGDDGIDVIGQGRQYRGLRVVLPDEPAVTSQLFVFDETLHGILPSVIGSVLGWDSRHAAASSRSYRSCRR
jgi:hypothetical protein